MRFRRVKEKAEQRVFCLLCFLSFWLQFAVITSSMRVVQQGESRSRFITQA